MNDTFTKEELIKKFKEISNEWIMNNRPGNDGGVGNTLEDLLGIEENNLPIANAADWELKSHRANSKSRITGIHKEAAPLGNKTVSVVLLPNYGWKHKEAGKKYPEDEMSFRVTLKSTFNERGFRIKVNREEKRLEMEFDSTKVEPEHKAWLDDVIRKVGPGNIDPIPYWGFKDLEHKIGGKLKNCFFVVADVKKVDGVEYYRYNKVLMLKDFSFEKFLENVEKGKVVIEFDARTRHNHGTKFRWEKSVIPDLYEEAIVVIDEEGSAILA